MIAAPTAFGGAAMAEIPQNALRTHDYVERAGHIALYNIQASRSVIDRSDSDAVRNYARQVAEHSQSARQKIDDLIQRGIVGASMVPETPRLPDELDEEHVQKLGAWRSERGTGLNRTYLQDQVVVQEQAYEMHRDYAKFGNNQTLRAVSDEIARASEANLRQARELLRQSPWASTGATDSSESVDTRPSGSRF